MSFFELLEDVKIDRELRSSKPGRLTRFSVRPYETSVRLWRRMTYFCPAHSLYQLTWRFESSCELMGQGQHFLSCSWRLLGKSFSGGSNGS